MNNIRKHLEQKSEIYTEARRLEREDPKAFAAALSHCYGEDQLEQAITLFKNRIGAYCSYEDYAMQVMGDQYQLIPEYIKNHIDLKSIGECLASSRNIIGTYYEYQLYLFESTEQD